MRVSTRHAAALEELAGRAHRVGHDLAHVELARCCHSARPGLELGEVEHLVDEAREALGFLDDEAEEAVALVRVDVGMVVQDLRERADRGERRAQLVRHGGDEVVLEAVELLQPLVGRLEARGGRLELVLLLLELVAVGDHLRGLVDDASSPRRCRAAPPARPWRPWCAPRPRRSCRRAGSRRSARAAASASSSSTDLWPRSLRVGEEELGRARRPEEAARAASAARRPTSSPRQMRPRSPVCVNTSTKSVAWLCSAALWRPSSDTST